MLLEEPLLDDPRFDSIPSCISSFSAGEFIVVLDSAHRENEGDLIIAAQDLTPEKMAFMVRHTSGLICAPLTPERARELELQQMVGEVSNKDPNRTAYTVSVDAEACGRGTGISATDRALTCNILADPRSKSSDLRRPGHVFPLRARHGGVRERPGHTEAGVDLCRLAVKHEVAVVGELVDDGIENEEKAESHGGGMMRRDQCIEFGEKYGLKVCTIEALVDYLNRNEPAPTKAVNGLETRDQPPTLENGSRYDHSETVES